MIPEFYRKKRALITGGAGTDGWSLIELLLSRGYEVAAHSRHQVESDAHGGRVCWHIGDLTDSIFLDNLLTVSAPDEVFNLAAVSQPALSWDNPLETAQLNALVPQRICEFIRRNNPASRLFQASSSEIFGAPTSELPHEPPPSNPKSHISLST